MGNIKYVNIQEYNDPWFCNNSNQINADCKLSYLSSDRKSHCLKGNLR